jgi:hypothetical protein
MQAGSAPLDRSRRFSEQNNPKKPATNVVKLSSRVVA